MNDKNKYDDRDLTEELGDEGFDSGKELKGFSGDEDEMPFGSRKEKEGYLPDFTDEMEYPAMEREKGGFFSRLFSLPGISVGWLGLFLVVLAALFLFLPDANRSSDNKQIAALDGRVKILEDRLAQMPKPSEAPNPEAAGLPVMKETNDRLDALEKSLAANTDRLKNEIETLKAGLTETRVRPAAEKAASKKAAVRKAVKPAKIKYHTVKAGENLYRIAKKYGLKQTELLALNKLEKNAVIIPGQKLRVSR